MKQQPTQAEVDTLIESAKQSIHDCIDKYGLNSQITIGASQELDKLLNKYGHILQEAK